ncbi:MAG: adenylyl-sulfate kinase [Myxococcales bacterium]|nr:adenylyl-sulfate kinase [Myxococcales bacterium]
MQSIVRNRDVPAPARGDAGAVLWLTGLSGAGKSTLARALELRLRALGQRVEVLDGDEVREHLSKGLTFSREDRDTNVLRIAYVANLLARNGVIAITAAISPYRDTRAKARAMSGERFCEVYVSAPLEACEARDVKGLYKRARAGEIPVFTGVSDPYEPPDAPELEVKSHEVTVDQGVDAIVSLLRERGVL